MSLQTGRYAAASPPTPRRGLEPGAAHPGQPRVRRQRPAHGPGRPHLCGAGDRQPDQRARRRDRSTRDDQPEGRRDRRARRRGLRSARRPLRHRGDGRTRERARRATAARGCCATTYRARTASPSTRADCSSTSAGSAGAFSSSISSGGAPRVLLENLPLPNALEAGPDGLLYFPLMGANEIWRIHPEGGAARARGRRPGRPGRRQVRFQGLHRLDPGGDRRGAAHRSANRRAQRAGRAGSGPRQPDLRGRSAVRLALSTGGSPRSSAAARPERCCRAA